MKNAFMAFLLVLLFAVSQNANAQEVEYKNNTIDENVNFLQFYENKMIHWSFNTFGGLVLNYGDNNWRYRAFGVNINNEIIRNALLEYPDSTEAYNSYKKNKITGNIIYWSGIVLMLSSLIPVFTIDDDKLRTGLNAGMLGGGAAISLIGVFQFNSAQSYLFNAENLFNWNKARDLNR